MEYVWCQQIIRVVQIDTKLVQRDIIKLQKALAGDITLNPFVLDLNTGLNKRII